MEASSAKRESYLTVSRLQRGEFIGMAAALALLGSLFLPWFSTGNPNSSINGERGELNAFDTFGVLDWLLIAACTAPFILAWIIMRGHRLTWRPGEVTMVVGITAFFLILCNGVILGKPGEPDSEISFEIGYLLGLLSSAGIVIGGFIRQAVGERGRKPPGTI